MKKIVLLLIISVFILTGCEHEQMLGSEDDRLVSISFSTRSLSSSLLKSTVSPEEESIVKMILFGVDDLGNVVQTIIPPLPEPPLTAVQVTISRKVKSLYAIANPSADIEAKNPITVSDLIDMTGDFSEAPQSPFLMSGKEDVNGYNINIIVELVRTVAKIEIIGKNEFLISSVTVSNTPDKGYVFKKETLSMPTPDNRVTYSSVISATPTLYVTENSALNPVEFVITGEFQGKLANYTIVLKSGGSTIDIVRNTHYQVNITPITESECSISINIPGWKDEITDTQVIPRPLNPYKDGIKILAIGNSYSEDAMRYMFDLLKQLGVDEKNKGNIKLVNAYIGGGSLENHAKKAKDHSYAVNLSRQTFSANGGINWSNPNEYTLKQMIQQEEWDVITLQQYSEDSGNASTYNADLDYLINYVDENMKDGNNPNNNPNYRLGWHMTWAYTAPAYIIWHYGNNQHGMYDSICHVVQRKILPNNAFDFIIPSGTAIQNARYPDFFGDILNRDGSHLNNLGAYIATTMWIKTITGYDIANLAVPYTASVIIGGTSPTITIDGSTHDKVVQAINAAYISPFTGTSP